MNRPASAPVAHRRRGSFFVSPFVQRITQRITLLVELPVLRLPATSIRFARLSDGNSRRGPARGWKYAPVNGDAIKFAGSESGT